jgi:hypothetical protein
MFNHPNIITIFILNLIISIFTIIALYVSIKISLYYDKNSTTQRQYKLDKLSYLGSIVIKFILYIKIPALIFFVYTQDVLSDFISGAMCGAGVVTASRVGAYLLMIKIISIYLFGLWLLLDNIDNKRVDRKFSHLKFILFIPISLILFAEIIMEFYHFNALDPKQIVSCCGNLFNATQKSFVGSLITISPTNALLLFYLNFIALFLSFKYIKLFSILNISFFIISLISLIVIFSPYIYELPTHKCPFCILQKDYYYIGYILYASIMIGTFSGIATIVLNLTNINYKKWQIISLGFNSFYLTIVSFYIIRYYFINGVWLGV